MSSDPRVPKNGTVSNSPFHFLEIFRQLVADFFQNSSYDVGRTMFDENFGLVCWRPEMKVGVHCANDKAPGNYARRKKPFRLHEANGKVLAQCQDGVAWRAPRLTTKKWRVTRAAGPRETFSVKIKDLTLHTSVDFGWFYGQVIRVLMWLPIIQSLPQEQQAWEFQFRSVPGFSMHKWWRNFFGTQWPLKIQENYSLYIYMYIWDIQGPLFTNHLHKFCPIWFIHSSALRKSKMAGWEIHHECRCKIFPMGKKEDFQPIILVYQKVSSSRFCCWMGHMEGKGSILGYLNFFGPNIHLISVETT